MKLSFRLHSHLLESLQQFSIDGLDQVIAHLIQGIDIPLRLSNLLGRRQRGASPILFMP